MRESRPAATPAPTGEPTSERLLASRYRYELGELMAIATAINSERDLHKLLDLILEKSRYITEADAGSVYVVVDHPEHLETRALRFEVAQNDSISVDFKAFTVPVSRRSIVGAAVITREVINIPDLYGLSAANPLGIEHDRSFDKHTGYQTRSVLAVPLITQQEEVIGVLQLINKKLDPARRLQSPTDFEEVVVPFDDRSVSLCKTLATQAAISLENALLYEELREVFEGFVHASVTAIESRDPTTSGHSRRVADLTVGLAEVVDRIDAGPYAAVRFSGDELKEIEYAGLLHDFGKIGVPEPVLLKAEKLFPWEHELLLGRFDYLREHLRAESLRQKVEALQRGGTPVAITAIDVAMSKQLEYLDHCIAMIEEANRPSVLDSEVSNFIKEISQKTFRDPRGQMQPYLTPRELECLTVRRGSLTPAERDQIESHVVHTFRFLCTIPWGRALRRIPEIARDHHEKLDGTGYPAGKPEGEIPVQAKMMAIADIFDALTASDRPYKKAVPVDRALGILGDEVRTQKLDPDLYRLFVEAKVFQRVIK
jgi:HD-GYP domain-containing protein (c-di-GMP phosphodiesterase class II)